CATRSSSRLDYVLHPATGEKLSEDSAALLGELRRKREGAFDVQIVISDGLNARAIMDEGHLAPFLARLRATLAAGGLRSAAENLVFTSGRVRAGYRVGEVLFGGLGGVFGIVHLIGERPGTGHHTFSAYITAASGVKWAAGKVDHDITKVVSGIAMTALLPPAAAEETAHLLAGLMKSK